MTLGCGGWGGNITSDNISPKHLLNIKRLAYETSPAKGAVASSEASASNARLTAAVPARAGLSPAVLGERTGPSPRRIRWSRKSSWPIPRLHAFGWL